MAKSENQKLKLLYLKKIFEEETDEHHMLTMAELIEKLAEVGINAERKAVYNDIKLLQEFGEDIIAQRGKNYRYFLGERRFELPELKVLVDVVQCSRFITHKKSAELIRKLEAMTSRYNAQELQHSVYVANRIKTGNEKIYYTVDLIHKAISENNRIKFRYYDWTPKKRKVYRRDNSFYEVSPWALTWDDENYYLVAYDHDIGEIRHYRVDRMEDVVEYAEKREGRGAFKQFDMALYSKKMFGMYGGIEKTVTLVCDNDLANVVIDRFGKDTTLFAMGDSFKVNVTVSVSPVFFAWVFEFGGRVRIESPADVLEEYNAMLKKAMAQK